MLYTGTSTQMAERKRDQAPIGRRRRRGRRKVKNPGKDIVKTRKMGFRCVIILVVLFALAQADRLLLWRNYDSPSRVYDSCREMRLPEGLVISVQRDEISPDDTVSAGYMRLASYVQSCYENAIPMLDTNVGYIMNKYAQPLPIVLNSWRQWTREADSGAFAYSVVPVVYSISVLAVVTWFLTIFVLTNYTIKASFLLRASTSLLSVYLLVTVILTVVELNNQQKRGYVHGAELLDYINNNLALSVLDLIVIILLQINQAQVIMRIFSRQLDKRLILLAGIISTLASQVIWALTKFYPFGSGEAGDILPAFTYLVRIAMGVCYSALITVYIFTKANLIIANKSIWLLTFLTSVLIYSPVAFFIADVSNNWISELSEIFSCVTYVICVVIPWEWCNKMNLILKLREKEGLLGRRFHEDEMYELDRYELFMEDAEDSEEESGEEDSEEESGEEGENLDDENGDGDVATVDHLNEAGNNDMDNQQNTESSRRSRKKGKNSSAAHKQEPVLQAPREHKLISLLGKTRLTILNITDAIIATGLAIPRSVSVSTPQINVAEGDSVQLENFGGASSSMRNTNSQTNSNVAGHGRNRRDVFVYARKEVVINLSDTDE